MTIEMATCTDGQGRRTDHAAEGWTVCPEGTPVVRQCRAHAQHAINEYAEKLGERWTFAPFVNTSSQPPTLSHNAIEPCKHPNAYVVGHDANWHDGVVVCPDCGQSRTYDAG